MDKLPNDKNDSCNYSARRYRRMRGISLSPSKYSMFETVLKKAYPDASSNSEFAEEIRSILEGELKKIGIEIDKNTLSLIVTNNHLRRLRKKGVKIDKMPYITIFRALHLDPMEYANSDCFNLIAIAESDFPGKILNILKSRPKVKVELKQEDVLKHKLAKFIKKAQKKNLFINRTKPENELYKNMYDYNGVIVLRGVSSSGMTTIINKVVDRFQTEQEYLTIKISFSKLLDITQGQKQSFWRTLEYFFQLLNKELIKSRKYLEPELEIKSELVVSEKIKELLNPNKNTYTPHCACDIIMEDYILPMLNTPLVLVIDDFDYLYEYEELFEVFQQLFKNWNESKDANNTSELWEQLRLCVIASYKSKNSINFKYSFGHLIRVDPLNLDEIEVLCCKQGLNEKYMKDNNIFILIQRYFGGNIELIKYAINALNEMVENNFSIEDVLRNKQFKEKLFKCMYNRIIMDMPKVLKHGLDFFEDESEAKLDYQKILHSEEPIISDIISHTRKNQFLALDLINLDANNNNIIVSEFCRYFFSSELKFKN
ncbi:AAA-like domain-containing protein [Nostoc sp. UIC 10890]